MCLVALAIDGSEHFPFVVASNRGEFFNPMRSASAPWSTIAYGRIQVSR